MITKHNIEDDITHVESIVIEGIGRRGGPPQFRINHFSGDNPDPVDCYLIPERATNDLIQDLTDEGYARLDCENGKIVFSKTSSAIPYDEEEN